MRRIEGLPESVSIESLTLRDDAYAVLCLICGGGGDPAAVDTRRGADAKASAWTAAVEHAAEHAARRDELAHRENRRLRAEALGWSQAQADAMLWADMDELHYDGRRFYRKDMYDPNVKHGRTVARARVQALIDAGFLQIWESDWSVVPTRDGHAARRAWKTVHPEPAAQESTNLRPLIGGEEEARRDAERAARRDAAEAERAERERHFTPEPTPAPTADPAACDHGHAWLYLTADPITNRLGYHLACACGTERTAYAGNSPAMNTGTATRPLGIADADTQVAAFHADRCGYHVTGRWEVLDEHTKRAPVEAAAEPLWPAVADPNRHLAASEPTTTAEQPAAESVTSAAVTESGEHDQDEPAGDRPCNHVSRWLYVEAEQPTRQLRAYLGCCERGPKLGNFNMRTAVLAAGRTVATAQTRTAEALAERNNYEITGPWQVIDEHTKRAAVRWTPAARPATETVTADPVTQTAPAAAAADQDEAHAAWLDRQAERTGLLTIDGPGIVGPGTHITWRDGRGPGMRSKHGNHGTVVRISGTTVTWLPYGSHRTLRTPLDDMRVNVPRTSATAEAGGRTAGWRRWSLAEHLAYARRATTPAPAPAEAADAAENAPQAPADSAARPARAEAVQLPLWPAPIVESRPAPAVAQLATVTALPVTESGAEAAGPVVVIPCSGAKLDRPAPAGELYTGTLYRAARTTADALTAAHGGTVWILSARHGFLPLHQMIEPYDQTWDEPGHISTSELRAQATRMGLADAEHVVLLTPAKYTRRAAAVWPHATAELAGRDIFGQRHRLAQLRDTARAAAA